MTLFPYANNVEVIDGELSFMLTFFDQERTTEMTLTIDLDDNLNQMIEGLMTGVKDIGFGV